MLNNIILYSASNLQKGGDSSVLNVMKQFLDSLTDTCYKVDLSFSEISSSNLFKIEKTNFLNLFFLIIPIYLKGLIIFKIRKFKSKSNIINRKSYIGIAIGGSPIAAIIPFVNCINYTLWIGTTLLDEYSSRNFFLELRKGNFSLALNKLFLPMNIILEYFILNKAKKIIVQSQYMGAKILKDYKIPKNKILYIPYPIEAKTELNKYYNFNCNIKSEVILLSVGRTDDLRKDFLSLIKIFHIFSRRNSSARLRIVGKTAKNSILYKEVKKRNLISKVDFLGEISQQDLDNEYRKANIFVLSPIQEGLGIVYLEAMSYGLPVVTTKCGGPAGIVINGYNGYIVDIGDHMGFSNAIEKILRSEKEYKKYSLNAYNYIINYHNPSFFRERFYEILIENKT